MLEPQLSTRGRAGPHQRRSAGLRGWGWRWGALGLLRRHCELLRRSRCLPALTTAAALAVLPLTPQLKPRQRCGARASVPLNAPEHGVPVNALLRLFRNHRSDWRATIPILRPPELGPPQVMGAAHAPSVD